MSQLSDGLQTRPFTSSCKEYTELNRRKVRPIIRLRKPPLYHLSYECITGFSSLSLWSCSLHSTTPVQQVANSSPPTEDASIHSSPCALTKNSALFGLPPRYRHD